MLLLIQSAASGCVKPLPSGVKLQYLFHAEIALLLLPFLC